MTEAFRPRCSVPVYNATDSDAVDKGWDMGTIDIRKVNIAATVVGCRFGQRAS